LSLFFSGASRASSGNQTPLAHAFSRGVLQRAGLVCRNVLAALAAASCVTACASGVATPPQKTLVFTGLAGEPDNLNPLLTGSADLLTFSRLYMSYLVDADDKGRLYPEMADRVPTQANGGISADGKTIVYHVRHGVKFQDGTPLTARDVVFSARQVLNPANNVTTRVGFAEIASVTAPRDDTVVVRLRQPFAPFTAYFFGPQGTGAIMPAHLLAQYHDLNHVAYNQAPVSAGPFRVVQWRHADSVILEANPLYWRGKPAIDKIVYRIIPAPTTRLQQLQTGEVDAYFDVDPQLLPQVRPIKDVVVALTPVNDIHVLQFNVRDPVVSDVRLRRAMAMAVNRTTLLAAATHGSGIVVDADQPRNGWAFDPTVPAIRYDPAAASRLLDDAGWLRGPDGVRRKDGKPLELTLTISPQSVNGSVLVATILQANLHAVGVRITIKQVTPALFVDPAAAGGLIAAGKYQLAYNAWWVIGPDPDDSWNYGCAQIPPNGYNYYFWCDARADAAMNAALRTYDRGRRFADYAIVQRRLVSELPSFSLWQVRMPNAYRTRLHGVSPSPFGSIFWNAYRWTLE
jgi:peptide/nickel transport system substrate-binding protein